MSPITSAKSAKTDLAYSYLALQANIILMLLACFLIVISDFPLAPSICIIVVFWLNLGRGSWFVPTMRGELIVDSDGDVHYQGELIEIRKIVFSLDELCILLWLHDGRRYLLWRDSTSEGQYRHILAILKKEH